MTGLALDGQGGGPELLASPLRRLVPVKKQA